MGDGIVSNRGYLTCLYRRDYQPLFGNRAYIYTGSYGLKEIDSLKRLEHLA